MYTNKIHKIITSVIVNNDSSLSALRDYIRADKDNKSVHGVAYCYNNRPEWVQTLSERLWDEHFPTSNEIAELKRLDNAYIDVIWDDVYINAMGDIVITYEALYEDDEDE